MNCKQEFLEHVDGKEVFCAEINNLAYILEYKELREINITSLKTNYTQDDYEAFLSRLDFDYDNGFGQQKISGTIWYKDGTFSTRREYDGSEWWEHIKRPGIPTDLLRVKRA